MHKNRAIHLQTTVNNLLLANRVRSSARASSYLNPAFCANFTAPASAALSTKQLGSNAFANSRKSAHIDARYHRLRHEVVNRDGHEIETAATSEEPASAVSSDERI